MRVDLYKLHLLFIILFITLSFPVKSNEIILKKIRRLSLIGKSSTSKVRKLYKWGYVEDAMKIINQFKKSGKMNEYFQIILDYDISQDKIRYILKMQKILEGKNFDFLISVLSKKLLKNLIILSCQKNDLEMVKSLLPHCNKKTLNYADQDGCTPIYYACFYGNLEMMISIFETGFEIDVDKEDKEGLTPLYWACYTICHLYKCESLDKEFKWNETSKKIVNLLFENGADVTIKQIKYIPYLSETITYGPREVNIRNTKEFNELIEEARISGDEITEKVFKIYNWYIYDNNIVYHRIKKLLKMGKKENVERIINNSEKLFFEICQDDNQKMFDIVFPFCTFDVINRLHTIYPYKDESPLDRICSNGNTKMFDAILPHCDYRNIIGVNEYFRNLNYCSSVIITSPIYNACLVGNFHMFELLILNGATKPFRNVKILDQIDDIFKLCFDFIELFENESYENEVQFCLEYISSLYKEKDKKRNIMLVKFILKYLFCQSANAEQPFKKTVFYKLYNRCSVIGLKCFDDMFRKGFTREHLDYLSKYFSNKKRNKYFKFQYNYNSLKEIFSKFNSLKDKFQYICQEMEMNLCIDNNK